MAEGEPVIKKKRQSRTTQTQYQLYVELLESNMWFRENEDSPNNPTKISELWEQLAQNLNASGGPKKSIAEWKRIFSDWKNKVRARARNIASSQKETGNVGDPEKALTDIESKLLYLTGEVVIEGLAGVPELGVENAEELDRASAAEVQEVTKELDIRENIRKSLKQTNTEQQQKVLVEINENLKELVLLKKEEIELNKQAVDIQKLKLTLKYDVTFEENSERT